MGKLFSGEINQHWVRKGSKYIPKVSYNTQDDANAFLDSNPKLRKKYKPYICSICGQWHIGHLHKKK